MRCQFCNCSDSKVVDSRPFEEGNTIRRRRECLGCGRRFTTYEKIELNPLYVKKRSGRREAFDVSKIRSGVVHACDKLSVSMQQIEDLVSRVERKCYAASNGEISTSLIGDMVMNELKELNDVAYIRFAAVYRKITDVQTFMRELQKLVEEKQK